jgi:hypothetical protein
MNRIVGEEKRDLKGQCQEISIMTRIVGEEKHDLKGQCQEIGKLKSAMKQVAPVGNGKT